MIADFDHPMVNIVFVIHRGPEIRVAWSHVPSIGDTVILKDPNSEDMPLVERVRSVEWNQIAGVVTIWLGR